MRQALVRAVCVSALACACSAAGDGPSSGNAGGRPSGSGGSSAQPPPGTAGTLPELEPVEPVPNEECAPVLELTVRDFQPTHPDFESFNGLNDIGCGMVAPALGIDTKPVFVSGMGTLKRVVVNSGPDLLFDRCEDWKGWNPGPVISGQASFDQWYRDVEGVNQTFKVPVELVDMGDGNFVYDSSAFFPVDGMGFGNTDGRAHNFHFTTEAHGKFGYVSGQKFTFRGDDDLWIFINGKLALDLGGMHLPISATIDFDAQAKDLGILPGRTYQMDIFHAERHTDQSNFRVETNIRCFETVDVK